jgi:hypothetical protein
MSSKLEVQSEGQPKKSSSSAPPVVYANGILEAGKAARGQGAKAVRRKTESEVSAKQIVQVVASGGARKKAAGTGSAVVLADTGKGSGSAAPRQSATDGSQAIGLLGDSIVKQSTFSSGAQRSVSAEHKGDEEPERGSGQLLEPGSQAAAGPALVPERTRQECEDPAAGPAGLGAGGDGGVLAVELEGLARGTGLGSDSRIPLRSQQPSVAEDIIVPGSTTPQPEARPEPSHSTNGAPSLRAPPSAAQFNGDADCSEVHESGATSTAGESASRATANRRIHELILRVSPKKPADVRRQEIVDFVHSLINSCFPAAVRIEYPRSSSSTPEVLLRLGSWLGLPVALGPGFRADRVFLMSFSVSR